MQGNLKCSRENSPVEYRQNESWLEAIQGREVRSREQVWPEWASEKRSAVQVTGRAWQGTMGLWKTPRAWGRGSLSNKILTIVWN